MNKQAITLRLFTLALLALGCTAVRAQEVQPAALRQPLEALTAKGIAEKVYVHTDKTTYMAGEVLWFKVYSVDALLHHPLDLSKVAYVDILDHTNNPVAQAKIALQATGQGSIHLPLSLASGHYKLRGYTSWMRNTGSQTFFEQVVTIINPLKSLEEGKAATPAPAYTAAFFPEGGQLVQGLESRLAFKLTDKTGKGVDGSGVILSSSNDTVATFATYRFGLGVFSIRPQEGVTYRALLTTAGGESFTHTLPAAEREGYTMSVEEEGEGSIKILVQTNVPGQERNLVYLLTHTRGLVKGTDKSVVSGGAALFYVDKSKLGEGVSQFTVFDRNGRPVSERLYFRRPATGGSLTVKSDAARYGTRSKVALDIRQAEERGSTVPANLSLSVYRLDSLQHHWNSDIRSYLWLTSELRGTVESPEYYLSATTPEVQKATDLLMLTHGWRRLNWKEGPASRPERLYPLEYNGHLLAARVTDNRSGAPAAGVMAFLSVPGRPFRFYTAVSDSTGVVRFDVTDVYGATEVLLQAYTPGDNRYRFEVLSPFAAPYTVGTLPPFSLPAAPELIETHSIAMQAQNVYRGDSLRRFEAPLIADTLPFYGKSDYTYALDEYTRFTTMEEVLREYVRQINVVARGGKLNLRMLDEDRREFTEENVLVMVDGVPLVDHNKIFDYDPRKMRQLDIIAKGYLMGPNYFRGVASFTTYGGNLEGITMDPRVLMVNYEGLQLQREFYSPVYETAAQQGNRIPDLRTTLLWKPDIITGDKGTAVSFYTSDNKGEYIGVLQGLDASGRPVSATFTFSVR